MQAKPQRHMKDNPVNVTIVGGGIIGVTTGIVLNLHGYKTKIYSEHLIDSVHPFRSKDRPPELASIHAAASIIPHTADHPNEQEILTTSQKFFHRLAFSANCGVRVQRHYELHEYNPYPPEYARVVKDLTLLPSDGTGWVTDKNIPRRKHAKGIWGWYFNTFFAEGPTYIKQIYDLYKASGGRIINEKIESLDDLQNLDCEAVINCTGRWAMELFPEDKKNTEVVRAHMAKVQIYEVPHDLGNQYFSYNYSPDQDVYSRIDKEGNRQTADVYFYPRSDGWLLGGSRQVGYPEIGEDWREEDEQIAVEKYKKPEWEVEIPKPIWELNRELIMDITEPQIDIANPKYSSFSYVGYRFARKPVRIEKGESIGNKLLLHNYGHGGAGYTLSWGSAYEILKILEKETNTQPSFIGRSVNKEASLSILSIIEDLMKDEYIARKKDDLI